MPEPVILEAIRIPFGKRAGVYRETRPDALLAHTLCGLVERVGIDLDQIEDIIAGCVTQAGEQGANIGRLAALLAGFPVEVPAITLDRMCGSSQQAVHFAAQAMAWSPPEMPARSPMVLQRCWLPIGRWPRLMAFSHGLVF